MLSQHSAVSISEIENAFFNYAVHTGVRFADRPLMVDGILHRVHVQGDKRGTKNGAYILHADGNPSGWFQHFNSGISKKWSLTGQFKPMSSLMKQQIEAIQQRRNIEQKQRHNHTAEKARFIWHSAKPITEPSQHPYLIKKRVQQHTARLYGSALLIPIYDENKHIVNLQFIGVDGAKRFLSGGRKQGCYSVIGKPRSDSPILIAEGWATGASLHEDTGYFTVVALDAGNLEPVAKVFRQFYPEHQIIICGDNDLSGTGQTAAKTAALAVGGKFIIPKTPGYDFNDMLTKEGA
jgi:putative DNA primase/helicase